ncbi:MAG: ABC transporter substrate-binding protein [Candidatus Entotheonellia bacterium]
MDVQESLPLRRLLVIALTLSIGIGLGWPDDAMAQPKGQMIIAVDFSLAPTFFDPAETPAMGTPYVFLYALHDALIKPLPGNAMTPCLAESWTESADGLSVEFKLREGLNFHNGDPFTAEDVKFSFERYKGASANLFREKVKSVEAVGPHRVRFHFTAPWPDFLSYYGTPATGAAWIVPKKYVERVGDDGFKKHPIGLGPYKFVGFQAGTDLIVEANEPYWRKTPTIKRLIFKGVPDRSTRLAMVKTGEADIGFLMTGPEAIETQRDPKLKLATTFSAAVWFIAFNEQWDPKSPWSDRRIRLAAAHAVDMQAINESERLGFSRLTGALVHRDMEFALPVEQYPYNPAEAKRLLAEAGYPNGFDGGEVTPIPPFTSMGEAVVNYLGAVGIKARVRVMERAAFFSAWREKKIKGLIVTGTAQQGNASARIGEFAVSRGHFASGGYPDIDELFQQQAVMPDQKKRQEVLHAIQRRMHERVMFAPMMEVATLHAVGPKVLEPAIGITPLTYFPTPYEDIRMQE